MEPLSTPAIRRALSLPLAVVVGVLIGLGQPPFGLWPATLAGVAGFTWLLAGRRPGDAALHGLLAGLAMNALCLHWMAALGAPVAIGLVAVMSLWLLLLGIAVARLARLRGWPVWVGAAWVAMELAAGSFPFGGFPWLRLGTTALDQPLAGWLAFVGVAGVTFLVALAANAALAALTTRSSRLLPATLAVSVFVIGGALTLVPHDSPERTARVGLVQGNLTRSGEAGSHSGSVVGNNLSETIFLLAENRAGGARPLDFVVWPENATDIDPRSDVTTGRLVQVAVRLAAAPVMVGAVMDGPEPDTRQTSTLWWDPVHGIVSRYDKRNIVPFGEWIPFRDFLLPRIPVLERIGRQSIPGEGPGVLAAPIAGDPDLRVGTIICFELAWDSTSYDTITGGARIIASQSNTDTYAGTFEVPQQTAFNRVRALETGREVIVSTLNGTSGLVGVDGVLRQQTAELTAAHRILDVPLRSNVNLAVLIAPWLTALLSLVAGVALAYGILTTARSGRTDRIAKAPELIGISE